MNWDSLPGDVANHISDIEEALTRVGLYLDEASGYTLDELAGDLVFIRDRAQLAFDEIA